MLAWVHQALASERELLGSLVGIGDDDEGAPFDASHPSSAHATESQAVTGRRIGQRRRWSFNPAEVIDMLEGRQQAGGTDSESLVGSLAMASAASTQKGIIRPRERLRDLLDRDLEGCCGPLKIRITHTLHSQEGSITAYKLAGLISFYSSTMEQTIGKKAMLSGVLRELTATAYSAFFATLDRQATGLLRISDPPEANLDPPPPLLGACSTLKELLTLHLAAVEEEEFVKHSTQPSELEQISEEPELSDFGHVIKKLVEPMLKMCDQMAESLRMSIARRSVSSVGRLGVPFTGRGSGTNKTKTELKEAEEWEVAVFLSNCRSYVSGILKPFDFVRRKVADLQTQLDEAADTLTELYAQYLLNQSGLSPIWNSLTASEPVDLPPAEIEKHLTHFDKFLASPNAVLISHVSLNKLQPAPMRNGIHARASQRLADAYRAVYEKYGTGTSAVDGAPAQSRVVMRRTINEVRLLLGADDGHVQS